MQLSVVMSTRSGTLGVPVFPSDFRILVMVPEGPAALPDAILQMAFVFGSFRFSTWVFSDWSSRFQGNSTGDFHNALFLLSGLSLGYICPDHRTIFRSVIFSTIFRHRRRSWASTYVLTIHTGIVRFFDLPFVDVLIQKRKAIVRQSYVSADST